MHPFSGIIVKYQLKRDGDYSRDDELHVNLWEVGATFIDIGVMINAPLNIDAIEVLLPWEVNENDIEDLGTKLDSAKSIAAIFNNAVRYHGQANQNFAKVYFLSDSGPSQKDRPANRDFVLSRLSSINFSVKHRLEGGRKMSELTVKLPDPTEDEPGDGLPVTEPGDSLNDVSTAPRYVRFRINKVPAESYEAKFSQPDKNILSSYIETRIIDFRINVRRGIPEQFLIDKPTLRFPHFGKIHFFLTVDRAQEFLFHGTDYVGCRSLMDEDVWNEYVKPDIRAPITDSGSVKNYLGYQWSKKNDKSKEKDNGSNVEGVKDLVALGRFSKTSSGTSQIFLFLGVGLIFSFAGNAFWEAAKDETTKTINFLCWVIDSNVVLGLIFSLAGILLVFSGAIFAKQRRRKAFQNLLNRIIKRLERLRH